MDNPPPLRANRGDIVVGFKRDTDLLQILTQDVDPPRPWAASGAAPASCVGVEVEDRLCGGIREGSVEHELASERGAGPLGVGHPAGSFSFEAQR